MLMLLSRYWWVLIVRGTLAILFGVAIPFGVTAFELPEATLAVFVLVFGTFAFVDGVSAVGTATSGRTMTPDWWILLVQGVFGVGIGLLALVSLAATAEALLLYIALWAATVGTLQLVAAVKLPHELLGEWGLALGGMLGIAFGIVMMWRSGAGALALVWVIASYAIVSGLLLLVGGFGIHLARKQAVRG